MKNILFIILLIISSTAFAQHSFPNRNNGSAKTLKGNVYTLVCFISEKGGNTWTKKEKDAQLEKIKDSFKWIERQALSFGHKVNFSKMGTFGRTKDIQFDHIPSGTGSGKENIDWISNTLYSIGYPNTETFYQQSLEMQKCDEVQVLIFAKTKGTSYAIAMVENANKELYFVEGAMMYYRHNNNLETSTASIAHEILHLYGAIDLYKTFKQTEENAKQAEKLFPNSIMRRTTYNIYELNVDEINAYLIGWTDEFKPWYKPFIY